jgi:hypothetical protein
MDIKELQQRQSWTLSQKIDHAVGTIEAFISKTGRYHLPGSIANDRNTTTGRK